MGRLASGLAANSLRPHDTSHRSRSLTRRALKRLAETNFRVSRVLLADLLAEDLERKQHFDE